MIEQSEGSVDNGKKGISSSMPPKKLEYSKSILINHGSVVRLTAGCAGSGADSGTYSESSFIGPDGSCQST
ncbi:hypothetical protein UWK_01776 [Desulfocapsa sulfexigens DSM 10523]|uniref:Uncharacterized protein n=1 Tax=Desulfocapsa sulfexigens (strain DSM 10523 / SB164P1) TaxID=1167006 RepID=M1NF80_DESSD|nr:hypothetical protein [Desulfocapsa sulfexigens]AGF78334.1 hypothetical protein UWK_01776 [Desulfocapsa sulfexigens DSM 10523]